MNGAAARGIPVLAMRWADVCFAHWRCDADRLQRTLPAGLTIDTFEDGAWLSVVPFSMPVVRPRLGPPLPGFLGVAEINLRTYVRAGDERGIFFYSLDASSRILVRAARFTTGLPYFDARMATSETSGEIAYRSERRGGPAGGVFSARYRPASATRTASPASLEAFLHERYRFFVERGGALRRGIVRHAPWSFAAAEIEIERNTLAEQIGLALATEPDACFFSRGVDVVALATQRVLPTK